MRTNRLLTILLLLQTRGAMTAEALARELEVSPRTVYRDIDALGAAGVPVYGERGRAGGYRLLDGYRTRLTGLTAGEAESLFLAATPGPAAELGLGEMLAAAQLKLMSALPSDLRERAGRIRERFHLDAPGWFRDTESPPHLTAVADAVWGQRRLRIAYRRWGGEVERTVDPIGLVLKGGSWYLVAAVDEQPRTYRVARIIGLETLPATFDRPRGFDLASYWAEWAKGFEERLYRSETTVRLTPRGRELSKVVLNPPAARTIAESDAPPDTDGRVRLTIPIESIEHGLVELLQLGADVEVLEPPALRELMRAAALAMARLYIPYEPVTDPAQVT